MKTATAFVWLRIVDAFLWKKYSYIPGR